MTFNIRQGGTDDGPDSWEGRKRIVFAVLAEYGQDIVGLQEALDFQIRQMGNDQ